MAAAIKSEAAREAAMTSAGAVTVPATGPVQATDQAQAICRPAEIGPEAVTVLAQATGPEVAIAPVLEIDPAGAEVPAIVQVAATGQAPEIGRVRKAAGNARAAAIVRAAVGGPVEAGATVHSPAGAGEEALFRRVRAVIRAWAVAVARASVVVAAAVAASVAAVVAAAEHFVTGPPLLPRRRRRSLVANVLGVAAVAAEGEAVVGDLTSPSSTTSRCWGNSTAGSDFIGSAITATPGRTSA